jgi:hypothetical protein
MEDRNKELLDEVIENRTEAALDPNLSADERKTAYAEAMDAYDRSIRMSELEASREEAKRNRRFKWIEFGIGAVVMPILVVLIKDATTRRFGREVMLFEKEDRFSYTPGQSRISSYFRHKD